MGGQFFPNGQGSAVDGGYRLSGSWSFGSGTGHAQYIAAGFFPMDDGEMRWIREGSGHAGGRGFARADHLQ